MRDHELTDTELKEFAKGESLIDRLQGLLDQQKSSWDLASQNYSDLKNVKTKEFVIDGAAIKLQYNPRRVKSTTADVSKPLSIDECILCEKNLPDKQKLVKYYKEYNFLVNPYPIFSEHFTIAKNKHVPQTISTYLNDMLLLSRDVGEKYLIFYNGPKCGASIPNHLHSQMGRKDSFPIINQLKDIPLQNIHLTINKKKMSLRSIELTHRIFLTLVSNDAIEIMNCFSIILNTLKAISPQDNEPKMNLVCNYDNKKWTLIIFLRSKHRPDIYFANEDKKIVVSPAAVDLSGLIILPRKEDLEKLLPEKIIDMYREVSISKEYNEYLITKLKSFYS